MDRQMQQGEKGDVMGAQSHTQPASIHPGRPLTTRDPRFVPGIVAVIVIWVAVIAISLFSPDNVSGSEQDHVPIAAILTWIWGLLASRNVVTTLIQQGDRAHQKGGIGILAGTVAVVWIFAAALAVLGPQIVTGADPTRVPIAALIAPIAAMVLTTTACQLFSAFSKGGRT